MSIDERLTHNLGNCDICIDGENYSIIKREINESSKQIVYSLFKEHNYSLHVLVDIPHFVMGLKFSQQNVRISSVWLIDLQNKDGYAPERIEVLEKIS